MLIDCRYGGRVPWDGSRQICRRTQENRTLCEAELFGQILSRLCVRLATNQRHLGHHLLGCSLGHRPRQLCSASCCSADLPPDAGACLLLSILLHQGRVTLASSLVPSLRCDDHNTMIDLDDKENQSPLRLGFGKSPSPKRPRAKNNAAAGQDVSDAPSKQSFSRPRPRARRLPSLNPIADLHNPTVSPAFCSQVHPPLQRR